MRLADTFDRNVGRRILRDFGLVECVMALSREDRGYADTPDLLHRAQNTHFVVDEYVVRRGIAGDNIVEFEFLVDIDQDVAVEGLVQSGAVNFQRLKDHVAVGDDNRVTPIACSARPRRANSNRDGSRTDS